MNLFGRIIVKLLLSLLILVIGVVVSVAVQAATQPGFIPALFLMGTVVAIIVVWVRWKKPEKENGIDKYKREENIDRYELNKD